MTTSPATAAGVGDPVGDDGRGGQVIRLLADLPTGPLLAALDAVVAAIDSTDPDRSARRAGLLGRLLGRDLVSQAHPDAPEDRVRVQLALAATHADRLLAHLDQLRAVAASLEKQIAELEASIDVARAQFADAAAEATTGEEARRLATREALATAWRQTLGQLRLALSHAELLLARHEQVRDLLVPLWRQHAAARALNATLGAEQAQRLASMHREALQALANLHAPPAYFSPTLPTAAADREPTP